jgi:hypothetical protein
VEAVGPDLWVAEGPEVSFYGFPYPTRMVVARLGDGGLWLWSPVAPTETLRAAVDALGPVRFLVSPNPIHHLFLGDWAALYPEAALWGPPSTLKKRADLRFAGALGDAPPPGWAGQIDQVWVTEGLLMDEVAFFHRASRTAILADLSENFSDAFLKARWSRIGGAIARFCRITQPWGWAPLEWRLSFLRRSAARATLRRILDWKPERVIIAHGEWPRSGGRAYLETAFSWLLGPPRPR